VPLSEWKFNYDLISKGHNSFQSLASNQLLQKMLRGVEQN